MSIVTFGGHSPNVDATCFVAPDSWMLGDVVVGANTSVFFGAVLRGDILPIRIGAACNLQEHVMVHTSYGESPVIVGNEVTVGHRAILHGCTVGDRCIIGMGATLLDGAVIEGDSIIGAHTLVPKGMRVPAGSLALGTPAKVVRQITADERKAILESSRRYAELGAQYRKTLLSVS
jgi:carbonic anhydrase/acetyltransferase-like protein (isoleucine patch superfamily)